MPKYMGSILLFGEVVRSMNETSVQIIADGTREPKAVAASSYRPALAVAFLASFLCILFLVSGWFEHVPMPMELRVLVALCLPAFSATSILYPSVLFRERSRALRLVKLVGLSFVLVVLALALLVGFSLLLFAFGVISPE